jgi:hypothetical protein
MDLIVDVKYEFISEGLLWFWKQLLVFADSSLLEGRRAVTLGRRRFHQQLARA